ncbi:MAG TPA: hypothetical protein VLF43_04850 [Candidatus Saccharimonadales bacterium]|nr:hypothetical protein [Candidatus Saccharimonadales bacterium]
MTELSPTVEVRRPVLNVRQEMLDGIAAIATKHGIGGVRLESLRYISCAILSGVEVIEAAQEAGVALTHKNVEELADHIDDSLPESANHDFIEVPALPPVLYKRGIKKHGRPYVIGMGCRDETLLAERRAAQDAASDWFGLPADHPVWADSPRQAGVVIVTGRRTGSERLYEVLAASNYFQHVKLQLQYPIVESFDIALKG